MPETAAAARARFAPLLANVDVDDLARSDDVICGVFADTLTIGYTNQPWSEFAAANGGTASWGPGHCWLDAISAPLRPVYAARFARAVAAREPWEFDYECASVELYREYRMRALVIADGTAVLMIHALRVERPHAADAPMLIQTRYIDAGGYVRQCAHCRRIQGAHPPQTWDWAPTLVEAAGCPITHGICEICSAYHFGPELLGR